MITLALEAFLGLPGLLSAQSPVYPCVPLRPLMGAAPDLTPKRGEDPDSSDSHDSGDQVPATSTEPTPATAPVIWASLLPAANLSFRPPMSLTDTANLDHAAINEKWPHGNQQLAAMPFGREEVQPGLELNENLRISQRCDSGEIPKRDCRAHWGKAILQALEITTIRNASNCGTDKWARYAVLHESDFVGKWFQSVKNFQWGQWSNADWWVAQYVGHAMHGVIYRNIRIQNPIGSQTASGQDELIAKRIEPKQTPALDTSDDFQISQKCFEGKLDKKTCKFHWGPALGQFSEFLGVETGWNLATNKWIRQLTFHGHFVQNYFNAVAGFSFSRWDDENPFYDDYLGHPIMGAIAMDIYIQNDPRGKSLELQNTRAYWHSRFRALLWSALYSLEWKLGPISEASVGNTGGFLIYDYGDHKLTTGTGTVGLVVTPVGGWIWNMAEDATDEHVIARLERKSKNPLYLFSIQFLNPCRGFSNLLRFKAPWYRDSRMVKAWMHSENRAPESLPEGKNSFSQ